MCGIAGIVKFDPRETVDEARLKRMRDVLRHRGPDGEGLLLDGPVGLGHRRLSIIDVAGGHQPMANEDETIWIVYNGEIYNHAALRPGLEQRGHRYRNRSDTETILHAYEEDGDRCVERLRGMFAFALWDRPRGRVLLARDPLGIKPLYYAWGADELLFASEIKAVLAALPTRPALNHAVIPEFLASRFVSGEETLFRGVQKLLPGRTLSWSPGQRVQIRRYWHLPTTIDEGPATLEEQAGELRDRLTAAVRSHLMTDVPLGLFLSGGIDSSALAILMARMIEEPVRTFSVGFDDPRANELSWARLVADKIGAEHREVIVSPGEFFAALPRLIWHEDEPIATPASVPLHFVSRLARDHVKVVLTGEGADELFLGYNRYRVTAWNQRLGRVWEAAVPGGIRRTSALIARALPSRLRRYTDATFLARPATPRALFFDGFAVFPEAMQQSLLTDASLFRRDPHAEGLRHYGAAPGGLLERMSHADLQTYLVELLMKQDQMSMSASIESRVPFLDQALVEYAAAMPGRFKLDGLRTKAVLREAVRDLVPPEILTRRKMGFPVPLDPWFRGPFWPVVEEFVLGPRALARELFVPSELRRIAEEQRAGIGRHADRLWLLVNLELWQRMFLDGEDVTVAGGAASGS
ncbi:MAG: asparagine synthase (glutamine-hydrolyzing) [Candidatus Rokuibacteriota bacterium]|nr:MAG: asparagine synthase (glutamine-hydrolyzing) [Candidatus Rokubacteria bacterium]